MEFVRECLRNVCGIMQECWKSCFYGIFREQAECLCKDMYRMNILGTLGERLETISRSAEASLILASGPIRVAM